METSTLWSPLNSLKRRTNRYKCKETAHKKQTIKYVIGVPWIRSSLLSATTDKPGEAVQDL